jgi:DNA-binding winged helix-turn-helix (wHTH) protein
VTGIALADFNYGAVLARAGNIHSANGGKVDFDTMTVKHHGTPVHVMEGCLRMLALIIAGGGACVSRNVIYAGATGAKIGSNRSVDTNISLLRKIFGLAIETVFGIGYRWNPKSTAPSLKSIGRKSASAKRVKRQAARSKPHNAAPVVAEAIKDMVKVKKLTPIPVRRATPMIVMDMPPLPESPEHIYRVRGSHIQWDGKGSMPELLSAYKLAKGELPSFITLPIGQIRFKLGDHPVTWSGIGLLPFEVLHHLDEFFVLPPWTTVKSGQKGGFANSSRTLRG